MSALGRPTAGVRLVLELREVNADAARYRGWARLPAADLPAEVTVARPSGAASARLGDGGSPELAKTVSALVRAATKAAAAGEGDWPRKIVRWRGQG